MKTDLESVVASLRAEVAAQRELLERYMRWADTPIDDEYEIVCDRDLHDLSAAIRAHLAGAAVPAAFAPAEGTVAVRGVARPNLLQDVLCADLVLVRKAGA